MITEDYVSFETAKLLKEGGFDEPCKVWYTEYTSVWGGDSSGDRKYINIQFDDKNRFDESYKFLCYAPTLQMARKWLKEKYNLYIEVYIVKNYCKKELEYVYTIQDLNFPGSDDGIECVTSYSSSEEASEAAIKYCLECLI